MPASPPWRRACWAVATLLGAPLSLVVPPLAARRPGQGGWILAATLPVAVGDRRPAPGARRRPGPWAILYGLGTGRHSRSR